MNSAKNSPYLPYPSKVLSVKRVTAKEVVLKLELKKPLRHAPGQFVMAGIPGYGEAPISIASAPSDKEKSIELCVRNVGTLTSAMHCLEEGDCLWIRGPYGRGFDLLDFKGKDVLFIAGGIGIVPMKSLIDSIIRNKGEYGRLTLLYGMKDPSDMLYGERLKKWEREGMDIRVTVDNPTSSWTGHSGVITTLLEGLKIEREATAAAIIGPPVMYKFVVTILREAGLPDKEMYLSLERRMKCGIGKCGHCQINSAYACKEGPVFPLTEICCLPEAI